MSSSVSSPSPNVSMLMAMQMLSSCINSTNSSSEENSTDPSSKEERVNEVATSCDEAHNLVNFFSNATSDELSSVDWIDVKAYEARLPSKPQKLLDFLNAPCPINEGKTAAETHTVFRAIRKIRAIVDDAPLIQAANLTNFDRLNKHFHGLNCHFMCSEALRSKMDEISEEAFDWIAMTNDVLPGTRNASHWNQKKVVNSLGYEPPSALQAVTGIFFQIHRRSGSSYTGSSTLTRCSEYEGIYAATVGCLSKEGLNVFETYTGNPFKQVGMAGVKLF